MLKGAKKMQVTLKNVTFGKGVPKICVPLTGKDSQTLLAQAQLAATSVCEVVEWRVDYFTDFSNQSAVLEVLSHLKTALQDKILLFTFRTLKEGGKADLSLREYQNLYVAVAESGLVDIVDVELERAEFLGRGFLNQLKKQKTALLLSSHNFDKTPADGELVMKLGVMRQFDADFGKIAVMPHSLKDVLRIMGLSQKMQGLASVPLILIAMGDLGKITRVAGELMGSVMTFAALEESSAPGQIDITEMSRILAALSLEE